MGFWKVLLFTAHIQGGVRVRSECQEDRKVPAPNDSGDQVYLVRWLL